MIGSLLFYTGLCAALVGVIGAFVRPRRFVPVLAGGLLLAAMALVLPAPSRSAGPSSSRLDTFVPEFEFFERHRTLVRAPCDRTYRAVREVRVSEIALFRTLTWLRRMGRSGPASILNAPERIPILEVATRSGFLWLADDPGREVVVGTLVVLPRGAGRPRGPDDFRALDAPGYAKAAMNFRLTPAERGCAVETETRVHATDARTRRTFARYWRVIYPGSALIRRMWLRGVRRHAEGAGRLRRATGMSGRRIPRRTFPSGRRGLPARVSSVMPVTAAGTADADDADNTDNRGCLFVRMTLRNSGTSRN